MVLYATALPPWPLFQHLLLQMGLQVGNLLDFTQQCVLGILMHSGVVLDFLVLIGKAVVGDALVVARKKLAPVWPL